jgi:tRNA threonylcarbamoyladenosine biosynthesis protein TsaE
MAILNSPKETFEYGKKLAAKLNGGDILLLSGELGAGKTSLIKGAAKGLDIKQEITSPTFTLMNIYEIGNKKLEIKKLIHIDTYRLKDEKELLEIGVEDYLGKPDTVCVIEWPEKISNLLKKYHRHEAGSRLGGKQLINIALEHGREPNQRRIQVS